MIAIAMAWNSFSAYQVLISVITGRTPCPATAANIKGESSCRASVLLSPPWWTQAPDEHCCDLQLTGQMPWAHPPPRLLWGHEQVSADGTFDFHWKSIILPPQRRHARHSIVILRLSFIWNYFWRQESWKVLFKVAQDPVYTWAHWRSGSVFGTCVRPSVWFCDIVWFIPVWSFWRPTRGQKPSQLYSYFFNDFQLVASLR